MTDEQITFAGIPIPLTIPTILDAMVATACGNMNWKQARRIRAKRQYHAFRDRILRMDAEKEERIRYWINVHNDNLKMIINLVDSLQAERKQLAAKDARIAEMRQRIMELVKHKDNCSEEANDEASN